MSKTTRLVLNVGLLVSGIISTWTGVVLWLFLPSGRRAGWSEFWSIARHQWEDWHLVFSLIFVGLVALHFALNWRAFKACWE